MELTRGARIFYTLQLFGIVTGILVSSWEYENPGLIVLIAMIIGGFAGEAWHGWRTSGSMVSKVRCGIGEHVLPKPFEEYFDENGKCNTWILPTCVRCGNRINT